MSIARRLMLAGAVVTPPPPTDPFRANVVAHLHFAGADESTDIIDTTGRIWTPRGNARIDADASAFEGVSLLLDGTGDWVDTPHDSALSVSGNDFTLEIVFQVATTGRIHMLSNKRDASGAEEHQLAVQSDNTLIFNAFVSGSALVSLSAPLTTLSAGVRYTASASRIHDDWYLHLQGILQDSVNQSGSASTNTGVLRVGRDGFSTARDLDGRVDEYRLTMGVGRYNGSNYTPYPGPFPDV